MAFVLIKVFVDCVSVYSHVWVLSEQFSVATAPTLHCRDTSSAFPLTSVDSQQSPVDASSRSVKAYVLVIKFPSADKPCCLTLIVG